MKRQKFANGNGEDRGGLGMIGEGAAAGSGTRTRVGPAAPAEPPYGNTGVRLTKHAKKVDWLNGTFPVEYLECVEQLVSVYLGKPEPREYGQYTYKCSSVFASKALLCWSPGRKEAFLSLNGDSLDLIPARAKLGFFVNLRDCGFKGTRVDLAFDDYERIASMDEIHAAAEARDFTGFRVTDIRRPKKDGEVIGDSRNFGIRGKNGGGKFFQIYDKNLESQGEINAIRYEARLFDQFAEVAFYSLSRQATQDEFEREIGEIIGQVIDFRQRGSETHLERMPRLPWWQKILDLIGQAKLKVDRVITPLQRSVEWMKKSVFPTLSLVRIVVQSYGADFLSLIEEELDRAEGKLDWRRSGKRQLGLNLSECFG